ncbi:MAG: hypothetical protein CME62_09555 [Halobacteriovoraceae bacterium]|nr:hypothetical protein [Halobacteriovoraceae bacterium]|tara:strand:- start:6354 stop:6662 length:309 start_codon:yes stop_codon:yes gene_type:complete
MKKKIVIQKTLTNYLRARNLSQSKLATQSGLSTSTLHDLLNGTIPKGLLNLICLAEFLGVGLDEIVFGVKPATSKICSQDLWKLVGEFELLIKKKGDVSCLD